MNTVGNQSSLSWCGSRRLAAASLMLAVFGAIGVPAAAQDGQGPVQAQDTGQQPPPEAEQPPAEAAEAEDQQAPATPQIPAVWKERKLSFSYASGSTVYSCRAMAGRVSSILRAVGIRDDVKVRVTGCSNVPTSDAQGRVPGRNSVPGSHSIDPMAPVSERYRYQGVVADTQQMASVYINAMVPVEVTGDVSAELEKDKTRRELIARATGNAAARFNDPILFAAQRQQVTLSRKTIGIEPEECELVDQMTSSVLPQLDVRVVSRGNSLCPEGSLLPPELVVEALMPVYGTTGPVAPPNPTGDKHKVEVGGSIQ